MKITKDKINIRSKLAELLNFNQTLEQLKQNGVGVGRTITGNDNMLQVAGAAQLDSLKLAKITGVLSLDTDVVDIFIYDTSLDTDGGAWRKRTSHTSWYNETLNTSTRGARRDFPATAVIVIEQQKLTIFDADDASLPMWMVFDSSVPNHGTLNAGIQGTGVSTAVQMLNGVLVSTGTDFTNNNAYTMVANFISEQTHIYGIHSYVCQLPIEARNRVISEFTTIGTDSSNTIASQATHDVAMTIMPNTPVDPACGLPLPTIALACADYNPGYDGSINPSLPSGVSVFTPGGSILNITFDTPHHSSPRHVHFTSTNELMCTGGNNYDMSDRWFHVMPVPGDNVRIDFGSHANLVVITPGNRRYSMSSELYLNDNATDPMKRAVRNGASMFGWMETTTERTGFDITSTKNHLIMAAKDRDGMSLIHENHDDYTKGMICNITDQFNTGWLPGDTRLALVDDTSSQSLGVDVDEQLIPNAYFDDGLTGWQPGSDLGASTMSVVDGVFRFDRAGAGSAGGAFTEVTTEPGQNYRVLLDIDSKTYGGAKVGVTVYSKALTDPTRTNDDLLGHEQTGSLYGERFIELQFRAVSTKSFVSVSINSYSTVMTINSVEMFRDDNLVANGNFLNAPSTSRVGDYSLLAPTRDWIDQSVGTLQGTFATDTVSGTDAAVLYRIDGNNNTVIAQDVGMTVGATYALSFDVLNPGETQHSNVLQIRPWDQAGGTGDPYENSYYCANGTNTIYFEATQSGIQFRNITPDGSTVLINNVSIRPCVQNHTCHGRRMRSYTGYPTWFMLDGMTVKGKLDKTPVAPGAELHAITGFSNNNRLERHSFVPFDASDFMTCGWIWSSSNTNPGQTFWGNFFYTDSSFDGSNGWSVSTDNIGLLTLATYRDGMTSESGSRVQVKGNIAAPTGVWYHVAAGRVGDRLVIYLNGSLHASLSISETMRSAGVEDVSLNLDQDRGLYIGSYPYQNYNTRPPYSDTKMCLIRFTHDTVTGDQIAKMYQDELSLFHTQSRATLSHDGVASIYSSKNNDTFVTCGVNGTDTFNGLTNTSHEAGGTSQVARTQTIFLKD